MGQEFWGKGANIQEGPGINVARVMRNGRNFEYVSGEDPVLGTRMVVPIVRGIQKNVMAIAKHYILNNQETHRSGVNELIDEKTLMELCECGGGGGRERGREGEKETERGFQRDRRLTPRNLLSDGPPFRAAVQEAAGVSEF